MANYFYLRNDFPKISDREYVVERLIQLKEQLRKTVPMKEVENTLIIGTWNIRDFGKVNRRGYGKRTKDSHYYIAEIISAFDFVAVQEINELEEWNKVMRILGPSWDFIATDITHYKLGGNEERLTFVYDKRKVTFKNIAGEIVLPNDMLISDSEITNSPDPMADGKQFRRTPFIVSFQSGWLKFDICTVHIYYGQGTSGLKQRIQEIKAIGKYLSTRADKALKKEGKATILLGDFNIIKPNHKTMDALEENGFVIPKNIKSRKTNVIETMHYDQIAFKSDKELIDFVDTNSNSGVFKVFGSVFKDTDEDFQFYKSEVLKSSKAAKIKDDDVALKEYYNKEWKTYQMSDHNLLWARVSNDKSEKYLRSLTDK
ncbi:MAG: endonuclease/exonuclease/phosphatase family protein [Bacteroidales bacterium]|jgi:endonuclease/exonuclease/phosphatase family metal-dependent hydrolase|nr:endonuclease/exonuclease/phosphatase family protein [Bacteroidales bacterium]MDI9592609.1 endonuclease/exonuclease/phosphatase family protein [Bacteroidota bacterium]NLH32360.1 endonuclease/exonuclease/phosphatase family protein [Lentimicrobium sp.]OQC35366.1 MAG: Endonuclease/Exonuclease/phosphatase family protein [Bacteroidetes bacterium ADurb.Bin041]MBP7874936.1 endonuclease/exonuclease/phosphatase family protein [Bacteroidales bacterium]